MIPAGSSAVYSMPMQEVRQSSTLSQDLQQVPIPSALPSPSQILSRDFKGILDVLDLGRLGCSTPAEHHIKTAGSIAHSMTSEVFRRKSDEPGLLTSVHGVSSPSERSSPASLDLDEHQRARLLSDQIELATGRPVVTSKNPISFPAQVPFSFRLGDLSESPSPVVHAWTL